MKIKRLYYKIKHTLWKRELRFFRQRLKHGWDDGDTFSLDYSLAKLIYPRLKRFKEITISDDDILSPERKEWSEDLDKMIAAFEWAASEARWADDSIKMFNKHQEGLNLFAKHYFQLWW